MSSIALRAHVGGRDEAEATVSKAVARHEQDVNLPDLVAREQLTERGHCGALAPIRHCAKELPGTEFDPEYIRTAAALGLVTAHTARAVESLPLRDRRSAAGSR